MADIVVTATKVARVQPGFDEVYDFVAGATITAGQIVYINSSGLLDLYDSNGSGTLQAAGVALAGGGAGQAISVLKRGMVYGYTVTASAYWAPLYGSNTAGALSDAAGGSSNVLGIVVPLSDYPTLTKVVYIEASWRTVFS